MLVSNENVWKYESLVDYGTCCYYKVHYKDDTYDYAVGTCGLINVYDYEIITDEKTIKWLSNI